MILEVKVNDIFVGLTIKEFLKEYHVGKGKIEEIRVNKLVTLNSEIVSLETKLQKNDILTFNMPEEINFTPSINTIDVVYEDEQILIVNKPSGILIHPDGNEASDDTLVNRVARYYLDKNNIREVRYAHRIDVETSGLVLFCKDFLTHSKINHEVENHIVLREYRALVEGVIKTKKGRINSSIGRDRHVSNKFRVSNSDKSKPSITNYKVVKEKDNISLVSCILETGRTHQIRVHLSSINHPLCGDGLYGGRKRKISRVALHSYRIKLINPLTFEEVEVIKDIPLDMKKVIGE